MANAMPGAALEQFNADLDIMLCHCCAIPFYQCRYAMDPAPYHATHTPYNQGQSFHTVLSNPYPTEPDLMPVFTFVNDATQGQQLNDERVQHINANETTVQPSTVQAHVEDTYTPGDRLKTRRPRWPLKSPQRRQAPKPGGGYPCTSEGCERTFDRACELNRHQKTHLDRSERPHKCSQCAEGFLYPKDLLRHERKHVEQSADQVTFVCQYPDCSNLGGFSRRDNLLRHQRKQHASIKSAA